MGIITTGGRDFKDKHIIWPTLDALKCLGGYNFYVVVGDARGCDALVREWCELNKVIHLVYKADWDNYGKSAGPIRNKTMLEESDLDILVAFPGGRGTKNCKSQALQLGIQVMEVGY